MDNIRASRQGRRHVSVEAGTVPRVHVEVEGFVRVEAGTISQERNRQQDPAPKPAAGAPGGAPRKQTPKK